MKVQLILISLITISCHGINNTNTTEPFPTSDTLTINSGDSTEYEIMIIEIGFDSWMVTNAKPKWFYTNDYYRNKNQFYVIDWNTRVIESMHAPPFDDQIDYDSNINYGLDVNYKLYWYFKFMQHKYGINLRGIRKDR